MKNCKIGKVLLRNVAEMNAGQIDYFLDIKGLNALRFEDEKMRMRINETRRCYKKENIL